MFTQQAIQKLIAQNTNTILPNLARKITQMQRLNQLWQKYIDIKLANHSRIANWRDGRLVVEIDDANWATHIRYSLRELLIKLKNEPELSGLKFIEWYIRPNETSSRKNNIRKLSPLSVENSKLILEAAEHISHEKLKKALLNLAQHTFSQSETDLATI